MHPADWLEGHEFTPDNPAPLPKEGEVSKGFLIEALGYTEDEPLRVHPVHLVDDECRLLWRLYQEYRGGGFGGGPLPEPGGSLHQAAKTMDAFDLMAKVEADLRPNKGG